MSISGITSVVTNAGTQINYVKQGSSYIWARPVTIKFKFPWTKFSSWSISRTSKREPTASTGNVATSGSYSYFTDDSTLSISGYYGDVYQLTHTPIAGYTNLVASGSTFTVDPAFSFTNTSYTATKLTAPVLSVYRDGAYAYADVTNTTGVSCTVNIYCYESQYKSGSTVYSSYHFNSTLTKVMKVGEKLTYKWKTNDKAANCTYASISAYFTANSGDAYERSDTTSRSNGTYSSNYSGSGYGGGSFSGFGGTLES